MFNVSHLFHVLDVTQKAKRSNATKMRILFCHVIALFVELQHLAKLVCHLLVLASMHNVPMQEANVAAFGSDPNLDHLDLGLHPPPSSSNTTTLNLTKSTTATWCPSIPWLSQAWTLSPLDNPSIFLS
jgi:hypothetical protein